jgi:hypothetical protein
MEKVIFGGVTMTERVRGCGLGRGGYRPGDMRASFPRWEKRILPGEISPCRIVPEICTKKQCLLLLPPCRVFFIDNGSFVKTDPVNN